MQRREFVKTLGFASLAVPLSRCGSLARRGAADGSAAPVDSARLDGGDDERLPIVDASPRRRPNIVFIMCDDHASQAIGCYGGGLNQTPNIDRLARDGVRFDNCFCTNALCAPSRATILTGKYSHRNGVRNNSQVFDGSQDTFPKLLQAAGYETALLGKWHLGSDPTGFDYWNVLPGQGDYYNPDLIEMGTTQRVPGYVTDLLTDMAEDFLRARQDQDRPFLLMLHHKAPHRNWQPAERHMRLYEGTAFPAPATLFDDYATRSRAATEQEMSIADDMSLDDDLKLGPTPGRLDQAQRTAWEAAYGARRTAYQQASLAGDALVRWKYQCYLQDYLGCIAGVDESVGRVLDVLDDTGLGGNTLVVYTSDQGFFLGQHGWFDKRFMYEESLRMPLLMRLPGSLRAGSVNLDMAANVDFAPTFLDYAGLAMPSAMQGQSLAPLLAGTAHPDWRQSHYYHYYEYPAVHMVKRHFGVRTDRFKLIHFYYDIDAWELYDLASDPQELHNVVDDPTYAEVRRSLETELVRRQAQVGDSEELARHYVDVDVGT